MDDIRAKLATGEYSADYIPTEEDYGLLLEICKANAKAQSEEVITVDPRTKRQVVSDTRDRKVSTMQSIGEVIAVAYRDGTDKISAATKKRMARIQKPKGVYQPQSEAGGDNEFLEKMQEYATRRCEVRDINDRAKKLLEKYETLLPKKPHSLDYNN